MIRAGLALAALLVAPSGTSAGTCAESPRVVGPCFTIHALLRVANGAPTFRLHPAGSKRVLGVFDGTGDAASDAVLPPPVRAAAQPAAPGELNPVEGDYRVCPLAHQRPGRMQAVCIDTAWRLTARPPAP
jgi:hypothetical protein